MKRIIFILLLAITSISWGATYYVATNGSDMNSGTSLSTAFATWQKGINVAYPGDTVYVRGGVYYLTGTDPWVEVNPEAWPTAKGRTGTKANPICFWAYPADYEAGNHPILDCSNAYESHGTNFSCLGFNAVQYWHVKGLTIRNAYQRGVAGTRPQGFGGTNSANLIFENCTAHNISGRGFYYESGAWNTWDAEYANPTNPPYAMWESDTTYFINCDAYDIRDSVDCSAGDGWKCGNYFGGLLVFEGCRAWYYSDDGFDPGGAGKRILRNCWAMSTNKYASLCGSNIEGNGFKMGGIGDSQTTTGHYSAAYIYADVYNCLAAYCYGNGFYNNLEMVAQNNARYRNNTSYRNEAGYRDLSMESQGYIRNTEYRNNIAYKSIDATYDQAGIFRPSIYPESNNTWVANNELDGWPGWKYNPAFTVTDADFVSLDSSQIRLPRKADGSLPDITFLKLASTSDLIDGGIDVGLPFNGSAPDLGYAEYGEADESDATDIVSFYLTAQTGSVTINATNHTVSIEVAHGTSVTSLSPTIGLSYGATINPTSGTARNFTSPVTYTVTAEDGITQQVWTITVTIAEAPVTGTVVVSNNHFIIHNGQVVLL